MATQGLGMDDSAWGRMLDLEWDRREGNIKTQYFTLEGLIFGDKQFLVWDSGCWLCSLTHLSLRLLLGRNT
jgi:hypothetical protein